MMVHTAEIHLEQVRELFASSKTIMLGFTGSIARYQHVAQSLRVLELLQMSPPPTVASVYPGVSLGMN